MPKSLNLLALAGAAALAAGLAIAQEDDDSPEERAHEAREQHMQLQAFNLGKIGAMAQGQADYDAAVAQAAADNLDQLSALLISSHDFYWVPGSSSEEVEDSRALPAIWENMEDFRARETALQEATTALRSAAGTDLASLQAALGAVGQACGGCHEDYRAQDD